jgi:hypothetical protein
MSRLIRRFVVPNRPPHRSASPKARLLLRALEDRITPVTIVVTNTSDGASGSLRNAIIAANADAPLADTIVFSNSLAGGATNFYDGAPHTISLLTALPTITDPVTIAGPGATVLTVAPASGTLIGVFTIDPGAGNSVAISGLTVSGGKTSDSGAGIDDLAGNLTLDHVTITNNSTTGSGGGVYQGSIGTLTVNNCSITGNTVTATGVYNYPSGGGICGAGGGNIIITNSTLSNNTEAYGGNGGGGVSLPAAGTLTIIGSTLANNVVLGGGSGGAILSNGVTTISKSSINNNTGPGGTATVPGGGGGIAIFAGGALNLTNSSLSGNSSGNAGAGIYFQGSSAFSITNCTIANNSGGLVGGIALVNSASTAKVTSTTISGNIGFNGGIYFQSGTGTLALDNAIISGNLAPGTGSADIAAVSTATVTAKYSALGTSTGYTLTDLGGNVTGASATPAALRLGVLAPFSGPNSTTANPALLMFPVSYGGTAYDAGDPSQAGMGFTDERGFSRPQNTNSTTNPNMRPDIGAFERTPGPDAFLLSAPTVTSATGAVFTVAYGDTAPINTATLGSGNVTVTSPTGVSVTVTYIGANASNPNDIVASYQFTPPSGFLAANGYYTVNVIANQVSDANGFAPAGPIGALLVTVPRTFTVTATTDTGTGSGTAGDLRYCVNQANSDLVFGVPDTIVFSHSTAGGVTNFYDNSQHTVTLLATLGIGAPITLIGPGSGFLTLVRGMSSQRAINVEALNKTVNISELTLSGASGESGNGFDVYDTTLNLTAVTVTNMRSTTGGAGIYVGGGSVLNLLNSRIVNNSSAPGGTGIFIVSYGGTANIINSSVSNNTGGGSGAGISLHINDTLTVVGSSLSGNLSNGAGAAIYETGAGSTVTISNSTIANNSASGSGGGLTFGIVNPNITNSGTVDISNSTLSANTTGNNGGALIATNFNGTIKLTNCTIAKNIASGSGGSGGGILLQGFQGAMNLASCTVTANSSSSTVIAAGYGGGGIADFGGSGSVNLDSTIVSGNSAVNGSSDIAAPNGVALSTTHAAIGNTTGFTYSAGPGDLPVGANLHLLALANNGGPTQTVALGTGSAAIDAGDPSTTLTTDQRGFARVYGPAPDIGAYEVQPMKVAGVQVNDGSSQRSEVRSISVTFSGPVSFAGGNAAAAFQLQHVQDSTNINNLTAAVSTNSLNQTVVTLTFATTGNSAAEIDPVSVQNGGAASLADGRYQLTVLSANVAGPDGLALAGDGVTAGSNYVSPADTQGGGPGQLGLYRIFGDATGDGLVDQLDLGQFRSAFNASVGNPLYLSFLDAANSGSIDQIALGQFRQRMNGSVFAAFVPGVAPPNSGRVPTSRRAPARETNPLGGKATEPETLAASAPLVLRSAAPVRAASNVIFVDPLDLPFLNSDNSGEVGQLAIGKLRSRLNGAVS